MRIEAVVRAGWLLAAAGLCAWSADVGAFSEDLCWSAEGDGVLACTPLPAECLPVGTTTGTCLTAASALYVAAASYPHARSLVHADATYLMAQAVGFSASDAYWIAAYDQAVDFGSYAPVDLHGAPVAGGTLATAVLDGLVRTNGPSGGMFFHFIAPRTGPLGPQPVVDGLHPNLSDADAEGFLVHLRAWAMAGSGLTRPACAVGLTAFTGSDYALGTQCFARDNSDPAEIDSEISIFGPTSVSFVTPTGSQLIVTPDGPGGPLYAESFDAVVGGGASRAAAARLGIYLHALGDRISHHVCSDRSALQGPAVGPLRGFTVDLSNPDCGQGLHALRHEWEVGIDQSLLAETDQTLTAALARSYDELAAFATARGVLIAGAALATARDALVAELLQTLQPAAGDVRMEAITRLTCSRGFPVFPGAGDCLLGDGFEQ